MGENSKIEWTTHTFNPWRGCTKVSPGCKNCYAETQAKRNPNVLGIWGDDGARVVASESMWRQPKKWNDEAQDAIYRDFTLEERQAGKHLAARPRVFCASMADVFEDRPELVAPRERLFRLIDTTPYLDWLLLTKRPENIARLWPANDLVECDDDGVPFAIHTDPECEGCEGDCCWASGWKPALPYPLPSAAYRPNVWLGTSVEDQVAAEHRVPHLLGAASLAPIRFLSCEPLLGPVDLSPWLDIYKPERAGPEIPWSRKSSFRIGGRVDWVIVGGESGPNARPMHPDWARSLRDQCVAAGVAFHFKQWGEFAPCDNFDAEEFADVHLTRDARRLVPVDGRIEAAVAHLDRVGKKAAGRTLDGREWNELPEEAI